MIDALRLAAAWALPWAFGVALLVALQGRAIVDRADGALAWLVGCGWFVGAIALTLWMRALSYVGINFSLTAIAGPLAVATVALAALAGRGLDRDQWRMVARDNWRQLRGLETRGVARVIWIALLCWLVLRSLLLLLDVVWTPLYPWDAWIQWATKARVWYEVGHMVPFARSEPWFEAGGAAWFDASPNYPATVPLWQVWTNLALGRWDDALMNLPWWLLAIAFTFAVYGALRRAGLEATGALIGTWMVSSLPLANVHVALAGYADLPMAAYFALAALAIWRWAAERTAANMAVAVFFAIACPLIKIPGIAWALVLIPGVVQAMFPKRGPRVMAAALAIALIALVVLARTDPIVLGYRLHLDYAPPWFGLLESLFLLGNWHLLWYAALAVAALAGRELVAQTLAPLTAIVAAGLLFLFIVFAFTNAREWVTDQTTVNRAILHLAPLLTFWVVVAFHAWLLQLRAVAGAAEPSSA
jgi:hypothetical protein